MRASLTQILHSCPLHPLSSNSKRAARRSLLAHCDLPSLLALRLVSRCISASTRREETRYFQALRLTLDLRSPSSGITLGAWAALSRIGHLARRVIITFSSGGAQVGFSPENERSPTLNPLPHERRFNSTRRFAPVEQQTPLLAGVFSELEVRADQPCGLFKRVLDLTPNMHSLCIRDGAVWADADDADSDSDAGWGRTLVDEALIFLRCQLEESLLSRAEALDCLKDLHRLEKVRRVREISNLETLAARDQLSRLEQSVLVQVGGLSRLDTAARSTKLAHLRLLANDNNLSRLSRLFQLEDSLLSQCAEVARLTAHTQLPKLLELQLGSPLALWHFRASLPYGNGSSSTNFWRSVQTLNITLPCTTPGGSPSRRRTVKKGIYNFLSEFSSTVESLGLGLATTPPTPERTNPLVYDLDPAFGAGAGEAAAYPALRRLVLKNMYLAWAGSLRELLLTRAPGCVELVLVGCTWESEDACRQLYELFELQNPQRLRNRNVPFVLMRKLVLVSGDPV